MTGRVHDQMRTHRPSRPDVDSSAFREDFVLLVARIGLSRDEAAMLVEASSGQPFDACRPAELLPILDALLALAQRTAHTSSEPPCGV